MEFNIKRWKNKFLRIYLIDMSGRKITPFFFAIAMIRRTQYFEIGSNIKIPRCRDLISLHIVDRFDHPRGCVIGGKFKIVFAFCLSKFVVIWILFCKEGDLI